MSTRIITPDGTYPRCKPAVGTTVCERCGGEIKSNRDKACPDVALARRWEIQYDNADQGESE